MAESFLTYSATVRKNKPSALEAKRAILREWIVPLVGRVPLGAFSGKHEVEIEAAMSAKGRSTKTINNCLTVVSSMLRAAAKQELIAASSVRLEFFQVEEREIEFYDFEEYARLVAAARAIGPEHELLVLLGGAAGLRLGEIIALRWGDCDLDRGLLKIARSEWSKTTSERHEGSTKGNRFRPVPMTPRLQHALREFRHVRGPRVLYRADGSTVTKKWLRHGAEQAQRRAGVVADGGVHRLRHSFCSHLAMRGACAIQIQRLAGHRNLRTTMRYLHLAPSELDRAINLLGADDLPPRMARRMAQPRAKAQRGGIRHVSGGGAGSRTRRLSRTIAARSGFLRVATDRAALPDLLKIQRGPVEFRRPLPGHVCNVLSRRSRRCGRWRAPTRSAKHSTSRSRR